MRSIFDDFSVSTPWMTCRLLWAFRFLSLTLGLSFFSTAVLGQKMLLLERANQARTTKMYIGERLKFRLAGEEDYWYERNITDMLPESNTLLLDNFPVKLTDIVALRVYRKPIWRIIGGAIFAFGGSLAIATTAGRFYYNDHNLKLGQLYAGSAASLGAGYFMLSKRTLKLGEKHRLRVVEINFQTLPSH